MYQSHLPEEYIAKIFEQFCEIRGVREAPPIRLMKARDRSTLARHCIPGDHDREAMWSDSFFGGEWLARYILEHPNEFAGKRVIDIGSGSGIVAIAAALVGAHVIAIDSNPCAYHAIHTNAKLNNVSIEVIEGNAFGLRYGLAALYETADIITAADLFYYHAGVPYLAEFLSGLALKDKTIFVTSQDEDLGPLLKTNGVELKSVSNSPLHDGLRFVKLTKSDGSPKTVERRSAPTTPERYSQRLNRRFALQRAQQRAQRLHKKRAGIDPT